MNFLLLVASIFSLTQFAFAVVENAENAANSDSKSRKKAPMPVEDRKTCHLTAGEKCSRELAGIIYTPDTCANQYLTRIADEIRAMLPQVFANMATGNLVALSNIANKYQLSIYVIPAYGYPLQAVPNAQALSTYFYDVAMDRNYLNIDSFYSDDLDQYFVYQFTLVSQDANLVMIRLSLPYSNAPVGCCK